MAVTPKVRFEVFKRDSFTCQYCGQKAPDVLLEADHIDPRANGGGDEILNLVTACIDCNRGKGAVPLDDSTAVEKKRAQAADLQERREQIEMMAEWYKGLLSADSAEVDAVQAVWEEATSGRWTFNDAGRKQVKSLLKKFGLAEVMESSRIAFDNYFRYGEDGNVTPESFETAMSKVGGIAYNRKKWRDNPDGYASERMSWDFVRAYRESLSHFPANWKLLQWWEDARDAGVGTPQQAVELIRELYSEHQPGSYWAAAEILLNRIGEAENG